MSAKDKNLAHRLRWFRCPLRLRPAARRQHLLELMRARVPPGRVPPKAVITASHSALRPLARCA